jgi:hypothetical protein
MAIPQNVRASDRVDLANPQGDDFVVRRRFPSVRQMAQICVAAVVVVLGVTILVRNETLLGSLLCVVVGSITLYLGRHVEKQQRVINATEFMNALFSSSLCRNHKFCTIVRKDGEIVYLDRGFQELFPEYVDQPKRELDLLLGMHEVTQEHRNKLASLISSGGEGTVSFTAPTGSNKIMQLLNVTVEPIIRPKGYSLVRGR